MQPTSFCRLAARHSTFAVVTQTSLVAKVATGELKWLFTEVARPVW
jgi:hypothetical protein